MGLRQIGRPRTIHRGAIESIPSPGVITAEVPQTVRVRSNRIAIGITVDSRKFIAVIQETVVSAENRSPLWNECVWSEESENASGVRATGLEIHIGVIDVVPHGRAIAVLRRRLTNRLAHFGLTLSSVNRNEALVEIMRIQVSDLIHTHIIRRQPLNGLASHGTTKAVTDEMQRN